MNRCFFCSNPAPSIEKQNAYNFCSGKICLQNEERQWTLVITKIILKAEKGPKCDNKFRKFQEGAT